MLMYLFWLLAVVATYGIVALLWLYIRQTERFRMRQRRLQARRRRSRSS